MNKYISRIILATPLLLLSTAALSTAVDFDPFNEFQDRFGGNQEFLCAKIGGEKLQISVSMPEGDYDQSREIPKLEQSKLLSIYIYNKKNKLVFSSWGYPKFDRSMKFMSIKLRNGKSLVFERYRDIPDPGADKKHFDSDPYFRVSIDGGEELLCGQEWNSD